MKTVFVIIGEGYTSEEVKDEIRKEGYAYYFFFATDALLDDLNMQKEYLDMHMDNADEIWTFGDVSKNTLYQMAVEKGVDIWKMG